MQNFSSFHEFFNFIVVTLAQIDALRVSFDEFVDRHTVEGADPLPFEIILRKENASYCNVFDGDIITKRDGSRISTLICPNGVDGTKPVAHNLTILSEAGVEVIPKIPINNDWPNQELALQF